MSYDFHPCGSDTIDFGRAVVDWANAQREDYWYPSSGPAMSWDTIVSLYVATVDVLGSAIEDACSMKRREFATCDERTREAVNFIRRTFGVPALRA